MTNKLMMVLAMVALSACLVSGGCSRIDDSKVDSWKNMFKIPAGTDKNSSGDKSVPAPGLVVPGAEQVVVKLYFVEDKTQRLVMEERSIDKVTGIARQTMNELIKGPANAGLQPVIPAGTRLLDINVRADGLCIIDLSRGVGQVSNPRQGELMIDAIARTMGQFPSVNRVDFLVEGEKVGALGGVVDIALPVRAGPAE